LVCGVWLAITLVRHASTGLDVIPYGRNAQFLRAEQQYVYAGRAPDGRGYLDVLVAGTIFRWHGLKFEGWNTDQLLVSDAPYRGSFDDDFMAKKIFRKDS